MALELVANAAAAVGGLAAGVMNFFTDMFLTPPLKATLNHLEETELKTLKGGKSQVGCCVLKESVVQSESALLSLSCSTLLPLCLLSSRRNKDPES